MIRPLIHRNATASFDWIGKSAPVPLLSNKVKSQAEHSERIPVISRVTHTHQPLSALVLFTFVSLCHHPSLSRTPSFWGVHCHVRGMKQKGNVNHQSVIRVLQTLWFWWFLVSPNPPQSVRFCEVRVPNVLCSPEAPHNPKHPKQNRACNCKPETILTVWLQATSKPRLGPPSLFSLIA